MMMNKTTVEDLIESWNNLEHCNRMEKEDITFPGWNKLKGRTNDVAYSKHECDTTRLVFTGSNFNLFEWVSNAAIAPWKGWHVGFYSTARRMLREIQDSNETLYSLKHSKGVVLDEHSRGVYGNILAYYMVKKGIIEPDMPIAANCFGIPPYCTRRGFKKMDSLKNMLITFVDLENDIITGNKLHMKTFYDIKYLLPNVKGFDHVNYGKALLGVVNGR